MKNTIQLFGEIGWEVTLQNVMDQVNETDNDETLKVQIHSGGGSVIEGLAIYNYLKNLEREVHTESVGMVASIASIIFLAGSKRTLNSTSNFLIHCPYTWADGTAEDLKKIAEELQDFENTLVDIYVNETNLAKDEIIELMKEDKFSDVDFLKEKGFVTDIIEFSAVAIFKEFNNKKKTSTKNKKKSTKNKKKSMSKKNLTKDEAKGMLASLGNMIKNLLNPENKLITDANGIEIDFPDVEDDATPEIGDSAQVDGSAIENGERIMPNGDTWKFEDGKLSEIVSKEEDDDEENEVEDLKQEIVDLKAERDSLNEKLTNEIDANKTNLEDIQNKMELIASAVGSDFKYENNKRPDKENNSGNRSFKGNRK